MAARSDQLHRSAAAAGAGDQLPTPRALTMIEGPAGGRSYFTKGTGEWHGRVGITRSTPYSRKDADDILKEAMADRRVGKWEQLVIWLSVRLGGASGWGR